MYPELMTRHAAAVKAAWQQEATNLLATMETLGKATPGALQVVRGFLAAPGKLIRPSLFLFGYEAYAHRAPSKKVVRLSMSFELLHLYLLIHDDIIDASEQRRGVPALHKQFEQLHRETGLRGEAKHFGQSMAIFLGDVLASEAEAIWSDVVAASSMPARVRQEFDVMKREVSWGQYQDVLQGSAKYFPSFEEILTIMTAKSGMYSIYRPLQLGALAAGASVEHLGWAQDFGINLGIAFQTIDDILGTFGDASITGKSIDSDLLERKCTLLAYFAFRDTAPEDRTALDVFFGYRRNGVRHPGRKVSDTVSPSVEEVRTLFKKYAVDEKARAVALEHLKKSKAALLDSGLPSSYTTELRTFADFIVTRKK